MEGNQVRRGWGLKKGRSFLANWKRRYFVLQHGKIQYFTDESAEPSKKKGEYLLDSETTVVSLTDGSVLENAIVIENKISGKMTCTFDSDFEMRQWIVAIQMAVPSVFSVHNTVIKEDAREVLKDVPTKSVDKALVAASDMEGWIKKLGSGVKTWKRRYMVLSGGKLQYFTDESVSKSTKKGEFVLESHIEIDYEPAEDSGALSRGLMFALRNPVTKQAFVLEAATVQEKEIWMMKIADALLQLDSDFIRSPPNGTNKPIPRKSALVVEYEGWLEKLGSTSVNSWKRRYFVLQAGTIEYFEDFNRTSKKGIFHLTPESTVDIDHSSSHGTEPLYLMIRGGVKGFDEAASSDSILLVKAPDEDAKSDWIIAIEKSITRLQRIKKETEAKTEAEAESGSSGGIGDFTHVPSPADTIAKMEMERKDKRKKGWMEIIDLTDLTWKKHYFVVNGNELLLYTAENMLVVTRTIPLTAEVHCEPRPLQGPSVFELRTASSGASTGGQTTIFKDGKPLPSFAVVATFRTNDKSEMMEWILAIDSAVTEWD